MEREIKFRGWAVNGRKMVDLKAITPLALDKGVLDEGDGLFIPFRNDIKLMQFTGLKDKSGKEIYEGDLVTNTITKSVFANYDGEYKYKLVTDVAITVVRFDSKWCSFRFTDANEWGTFEVIGNIWENPELIPA